MAPVWTAIRIILTVDGGEAFETHFSAFTFFPYSFSSFSPSFSFSSFGFAGTQHAERYYQEASLRSFLEYGRRWYVLKRFECTERESHTFLSVAPTTREGRRSTHTSVLPRCQVSIVLVRVPVLTCAQYRQHRTQQVTLMQKQIISTYLGIMERDGGE